MTAEQYLLAAVGTALIIVGVFRVTERGTVLKRLSYKFNSLGALLITAGDYYSLSHFCRQFEGVGYGSGQKRLIPRGLLAEREALTAARNQRTLTQDFCGDAPPGYSALDGKTGQRLRDF
jgi:hypothetical protein